MKKASEIFEGEDSSLRKTYEEAVKKELKQCTKCHTMKNIEGDTCARCEEKDTESQSGIHLGKDVYGKLEQEIMEDLNKILWKNIDDNVLEPERPMKTQLQNDLKDFISHIITLVRKREREEMVEELTRRLIETYKTKESEDYVKGQYDTLFDLKTYLMTL